MLYGHLEYFVVIWNNLWLFGTFFSVLVCLTEKDLAALVESLYRLLQTQVFYIRVRR
jgi:hypothetical protein